jgi:ATP-binding cassette subfamily C protein LapB
VGVGIAFFFDFALRNLRGYFVDVAGRNSDILVASKLMSHILSIRLDHKPESTGALVNNMREFDSLREFFSSTTLLALVDLPFLILFITIIFYIGGPVAFVPAVVCRLISVQLTHNFGFFLRLSWEQKKGSSGETPFAQVNVAATLHS